MSAGDGVSHRWKRNGKFCTAAGPVSRNAVADIFKSVKGHRY